MVTKETKADAVFRALADPTRRAILDLLATGPRAVGEISERFPVSRPAISKHLRLLREAGLVSETRKGRERLYRAITRPLEAASAWLAGHLGPATGASGTPPRRSAAERPAEAKQPRRRPPSPPRSGDWRVW